MATKFADSLRLQLEEMYELKSWFKNDEIKIDFQKGGDVDRLERITKRNGAGIKATDFSQPIFEYNIELTCSADENAARGQKKVTMTVKTPRAYPDRAMAEVTVGPSQRFASVESERSFHELLQGHLHSLSAYGEGVVLNLAEFIREEAHPFLRHEVETVASPSSQAQAMMIHRGFVAFHHMLYGKEHKKEQKVVALAKDLGLSGFIVYGKPSLVCVEGSTSAEIEEFVQESKRCGKAGDITYVQVDHDAQRKCNNGKPGFQQIHALGKGGETPDTHALIAQLTVLGLKDKRKEITGRE